MRTNNNKNNEEFLKKILKELEDAESKVDFDEDLKFELDMLSQGSRTKPVFYD